MIPPRYEPTDDERAKAKRRCVNIGAATEVIRGIFGACLEGIIEAEKRLLSDGGCVRAVPLNSNSHALTELDPSATGYSAQIAIGLQYRLVTQALNDAADVFCQTNLDWRETERLAEIA